MAFPAQSCRLAPICLSLAASPDRTFVLSAARSSGYSPLCGTKLPLLDKPFLEVDAVEAVFGVTSYFGITKRWVDQQVLGHLLVCVEMNGC